MQCNIQPCNGRILVKFTKADQERITDTGILIPNHNKSDKLWPALVVAAADDVTEACVGDIVLVHFNDGFDILAADNKTVLRFLSQTGIYGIIHPEEPEDEGTTGAALDCAAGASPLPTGAAG